MLEDGFRDELNEIIESLPPSRQTMLFSTTMTDDVNTLIRLSLPKPVRLFVDPNTSTVTGLTQEFIRVRPEKETLRSAMLVTLCRFYFTSRVIIFFRSKAFAHRMRIIFGLLNLKAGELHGSLSQEQVTFSLSLTYDRECQHWNPFEHNRLTSYYVPILHPEDWISAGLTQ